MFQGEFWIYDTELRINFDRGGFDWMSKDYKEWERKMHDQVLYPIHSLLEQLNYRIESQTHIFKYAQNRYARKGDLRLDILDDCGVIKIIFFQNVNAPNRSDHGGRYEPKKITLMPFLMRLEMIRTMNRIIQFIQDNFDVSNFDASQDLSRDRKDIGLGGITTAQWLEHYKGEYDSGMQYKSNTESADAKTISNGDRVWFYDRKGRLNVGIARYNINNMWWVIKGKYSYTNMGAHDLYLCMPHSPRIKKNSYERRAKMSQEAFNLRMDGAQARADSLNAKIKNEFGNTGLWITRNQAREYFKRCGLRYSDITKAKFDELRKKVDAYLKNSGMFEGSYKCNRKTKYHGNKAGLDHAYIGCQAHYFSDREAIHLYRNGEIGFAGWAGHEAVKPILEAFVEWCDEIKK